MTATKVLIVDDSITMRALFSSALERGKDLVVVGAANGADEAREMIASLRPDVITLDVEMPGKNGLEFLEELMSTRPIPVIMLSTLTQKGADVSLRALEIGAVDCFPKPARATPDEFEKIAGKLCKLVSTAGKTNMAAKRPAPKAAAAAGSYQWDGSLLVATGGMGAIEAATELLTAMPANCPPTILLLDMEDGLAVSFGAKLAAAVPAKVKVAADGVELEQGVIYVATDSTRHVAVDHWPNGRLRLVDRDPVNGHRPSADVLLGTVARVAGEKATAVMLSGAGIDGVAGFAAVAAAGGVALLQARDTALIAEAIDACATKVPAVRSMTLGDIAAAVTTRGALPCAA